MKKGIKGEAFEKGELIYVFEYEFCEFVGLAGIDKESCEEIFEVKCYNGLNTFLSSSCFKIGNISNEESSKKINVDDPQDFNYDYYRIWELGEKRIKLTYDPIKIYNLSDKTLVRYNLKDDFEYFETGEELNIDWEGMGVELDMIIEKWLRRLNGEIIPFSEYYLDPLNRYFDQQ